MIKLHLTLCNKCGDHDFEKARAALDDAGMSKAVELRSESCLGPCDRPMVMALQSAGSAGYVFAGIDLARDAQDIVATCALYFASNQGWIEDARPCGRLRHMLVARMPG